MYGNSKKFDSKRNSRRTPSYSAKKKTIEILVFKETTNADLYEGLEVSYQDLAGVFSKLGIITDSFEQDGIKLYLISSSFGAFMANELKLIKHH